MIANTSGKVLMLEKGESVGQVEVLRNASIYAIPPHDFSIADIDKFITCYKGCERNKQSFVDMIRQILELETQKRDLTIQHDINLDPFVGKGYK